MFSHTQSNLFYVKFGDDVSFCSGVFLFLSLDAALSPPLRGPGEGGLLMGLRSD